MVLAYIQGSLKLVLNTGSSPLLHKCVNVVNSVVWSLMLAATGHHIVENAGDLTKITESLYAFSIFILAIVTWLALNRHKQIILEIFNTLQINADKSEWSLTRNKPENYCD